jgi:hypothetical protein
MRKNGVHINPEAKPNNRYDLSLKNEISVVKSSRRNNSTAFSINNKLMENVAKNQLT